MLASTLPRRGAVYNSGAVVNDGSTLPAIDGGQVAAARSPPGAGTVLAERYRLVKLVGSGGMGTVWEGEHLALGTPLAVKLINPSLSKDELARGRFLREARAAAALRGPNVVQIFDYGVHEDTPYIAMELLDGQSLASKLRRAGRLSVRATHALMSDLFRAVGKAHEAGLVHRDLKPDNVFIVEGDEGDVAKVLDFGIAKALDPGAPLEGSTQEGTMLGTPFYMSPEQLMDSGLVDTRSDIWSLAIIAYECLLGERPFAAESMPSLAVALLAEAPPVPSAQGDVPPGFDAWFFRATQRDPEARFIDTKEMGQALDLVLSGHGEQLELTPETISAPIEAERRRPMWIVGSVGLLTLAVGLGYAALAPRAQLEGLAATAIRPVPPMTLAVVAAPPTTADPVAEPSPELEPEPPATTKAARPKKPPRKKPTTADKKAKFDVKKDLEY